jgi:hypothetical protein
MLHQVRTADTGYAAGAAIHARCMGAAVVRDNKGGLKMMQLRDLRASKEEIADIAVELGLELDEDTNSLDEEIELLRGLSW